MGMDKRLLEELEKCGAIGPPSRVVRARGPDLEAVARRAAELARRWRFEGYDLRQATVTLSLARSDDFEESERSGEHKASERHLEQPE